MKFFILMNAKRIVSTFKKIQFQSFSKRMLNTVQTKRSRGRPTNAARAAAAAALLQVISESFLTENKFMNA